jgi:ribosomal protein L17
MPIMFNVMEAFFNLDKRLNYWTLLDEEDYSISFFDFIDFYTSSNLNQNKSDIIENFQEDLIYNFNVQFDLKEIKFRTEEGETFVIGGVSMVRRGNEVTMLFNSGEITDTIIKTKELEPLNKKGISKGKENLVVAKDRIREAVKLNDDPMLWKVLVVCRFDLETNTLDARYIAKDEGNSYSIITDDITGFVVDGNWREEKFEKFFKDMAKKVETYNPIFELAKACMSLPNYFNFYDEEIEEENQDTEVKTILKNPFKNKEYKCVQDKFKIRSRSLWKLNRNRIFLASSVKLRDDNFKVETSGYWKPLNEEEIGCDKKGNPITGKTWVQKTESYYIANQEELIIEKTNEIEFDGPNVGKIYIMRNSSLPKNVFKIGLTTKETEERAAQLSDTSIPDRYYVMREWKVKDCYLAEKTIHKLLEKKRVDPRREHFIVEMKEANDIIDSVVNEINNN